MQTGFTPLCGFQKHGEYRQLLSSSPAPFFIELKVINFAYLWEEVEFKRIAKHGQCQNSHYIIFPAIWPLLNTEPEFQGISGYIWYWSVSISFPRLFWSGMKVYLSLVLLCICVACTTVQRFWAVSRRR